MIEKIEGIVINEKDFSETSKIINVLTKDKGLIGIMCKGAKTMKSPFRSVTGKLTYGIFNVYYKKDKLSTLISVDVIDNFKNIKKDIEKISYASFLLELAEQVNKQSLHNGIYDLLINGLLKINEGFDPLVITNIIELKYLDYLGVMPVIDRCSMCGRTNSIATLSSSKGGYICNNCLTTEKIVSEKTIKLIRMFYYVDISKITKMNINNLSKLEINAFIDEYYDKYTGLYLKSKSFINDLKRINIKE